MTEHCHRRGFIRSDKRSLKSMAQDILENIRGKGAKVCGYFLCRLLERHAGAIMCLHINFHVETESKVLYSMIYIIRH